MKYFKTIIVLLLISAVYIIQNDYWKVTTNTTALKTNNTKITNKENKITIKKNKNINKTTKQNIKFSNHLKHIGVELTPIDNLKTTDEKKQEIVNLENILERTDIINELNKQYLSKTERKEWGIVLKRITHLKIALIKKEIDKIKNNYYKINSEHQKRLNKTLNSIRIIKENKS